MDDTLDAAVQGGSPPKAGPSGTAGEKPTPVLQIRGRVSGREHPQGRNVDLADGPVWTDCDALKRIGPCILCKHRTFRYCWRDRVAHHPETIEALGPSILPSPLFCMDSARGTVQFT
jgi:hypothetical protein